MLSLGWDAIMFPSVQTEGKSFDVAIKGEVVDKCLDTDIVGIGHGKKNGKQIDYGWLLSCDNVGREGNIGWKQAPIETSVFGKYAPSHQINNNQLQ